MVSWKQSLYDTEVLFKTKAPVIHFSKELIAQGLDKQTKCLSLSVCLRYVFHSAGIFPEPSYQNRVEYLGQPGTKNCSLRISDLRQSDSGSYVFYLITSHPTQKMPEQSGIQLLVAGRNRFHLQLTTDHNEHDHHLHNYHHLLQKSITIINQQLIICRVAKYLRR